MAGHNKWSKVKHIKAKEDAKKGRVFSKLAHEITIAVKTGGGDPKANPRLRSAIESARAVSMPKDNIDRAIKKGTGELEGGNLEEIYYEGFAPGGVGFIVHVASDNRNRSAAELRMIFNKHQGTMGATGSVAHLFNLAGEVRVPLATMSDETALEAALEAGAEDVQADGDDHVILTAADQLGSVANHLRDTNVEVRSQSLVYLPMTSVEVADPALASQVLKLYEALDDYDDTMNVFANFDIPDAVMESL